MIDMSKYTAPKTDQLNSDDLVGKTITIKITKITGKEGEQPISIFFEGDNGKPYKPCKSMIRILRHIWGDNGNLYVGRQLTLYRDPEVKFGGLEVGGIRISHASHISQKMTTALTASKANKRPFTVLPLQAAADDPELATLKPAGEAASAKGVAGYTEWKDTLTPEQKEKIKPFHAGWTRAAKAADEKVAQSAEPPEEEPPV